MNPQDIINNALDIVKNKYFCFDGRASQKEFWLFVLAVFLCNIILGIVDSIINIRILSSLFSLAICLPMLGVTARRLHDIGKSGWFQLIGLIPVIGAIILLIVCIPAGAPSANAYGEAPQR